MNRRAPFTQADVTRALKGAKNAGVVVGGLEIEPGGKIIILVEGGKHSKTREQTNEWDEVLTDDAEEAS